MLLKPKHIFSGNLFTYDGNYNFSVDMKFNIRLLNNSNDSNLDLGDILKK